MVDNDWRPADEKPTAADCGPNGRILVWHRYNGAMIANVYQLAENRFMEWWLPYPAAPEGAIRLMDEADSAGVRWYGQGKL